MSDFSIQNLLKKKADYSMRSTIQCVSFPSEQRGKKVKTSKILLFPILLLIFHVSTATVTGHTCCYDFVSVMYSVPLRL